MSKTIYIIFFMVLIISMGAACASEDSNQTGDILTIQDEAGLQDTLDKATFDDIQTEIDSADEGSTINLNGNYESIGSEIIIDKTIKINGHKNTTLDGKKSSSFFYLDHIPRLEVNGVKFTNGYDLGDTTGAKANGYADEYVFSDCEFTANYWFFLDIASKKATFTNCKFTDNDNCIYMLDSDELTVRNCVFTKNTNQLIMRAKTVDRCTFLENMGVEVNTMGTVQSITNSKFIKNLLSITSVALMQNNRFESNEYKYYLSENAGTVDNCVFIKNNEPTFGKCKTLKNSRFENNVGDIIKNGGTVTNCRFTGNTGGYTLLNVVSITNSYFKNNKDCFIQNKKLTVKNTQFTNNRGYVVGAKIDKCTFYSNDMDVEADTISNSKFTKNTFKAYMVTGKTIKKCTFTKNKCLSETMLSAKTLKDSKFTKNTCTGMLAAASKVYNCRFEKNSVAKKYFGVVVGGAKLIKKCTFKYNTAKKGNIVIGTNTIDGCTFTKNKVTDNAEGTVYYVKKVLNTKFIGNKVLRGYGGAINDVDVVKKCTFKSNYALVGGAISTLSKFTIEKCTFTKNKVKHSASAIFVSALSGKVKGTIKNCKFSKNKAKGKINTYEYPSKNYKRGTIFAYGDYKMSIKVKGCKGL